MSASGMAGMGRCLLLAWRVREGVCFWHGGLGKVFASGMTGWGRCLLLAWRVGESVCFWHSF